jgi:hypothetical protein
MGITFVTSKFFLILIFFFSGFLDLGRWNIKMSKTSSAYEYRKRFFEGQRARHESETKIRARSQLAL